MYVLLLTLGLVLRPDSIFVLCSSPVLVPTFHPIQSSFSLKLNNDENNPPPPSFAFDTDAAELHKSILLPSYLPCSLYVCILYLWKNSRYVYNF